MKYTNETVRRQDRLMDENDAVKLLSDSEYGVLSMQGVEGGGYGVPVNYVWDGHEALYIHCAPEGEKLRCIASNPNVTFCIIGHTRLIPRMFTTEYNSIILKGKASLVSSDEERMESLRLLVKKLSPDYIEIGEKYSVKSFHRVGIIRIDITEWSGKCKHVKQDTDK
jgi:nitroimidazol reductase NimA-like FMN-containing flavoprotein (pyridoxamine 5'-phosphate oxidase superfamily)